METRQLAVRLVAYGLTTVVVYAGIALGMFIISVVTLNQEVVFSYGILNSHQRFAYYGGIRELWQHQPSCVTFDPDLLYKPKPGQCTFNNPEFKTTLSFDESGRISGNKSDKIGIAVLGDSHAMGWGVDDEDTFAAILELYLHRPVYNLAVASYETYRELRRLEKSGLLERIDTIVLQYCDNDLPANIERLRQASTPTYERFTHMLVARGPGRASILLSWVTEALAAPLREIHKAMAENEDSYDFAPHYDALQEVFRQYPWLNTKKVIVFYSNDGGKGFRNFVDIVSHSQETKITFIDLDLGRELYYVIDDHLTRSGHYQVAKQLAPLVSQ